MPQNLQGARSQQRSSPADDVTTLACNICEVFLTPGAARERAYVRTQKLISLFLPQGHQTGGGGGGLLGMLGLGGGGHGATSGSGHGNGDIGGGIGGQDTAYGQDAAYGGQHSDGPGSVGHAYNEGVGQAGHGGSGFGGAQQDAPGNGFVFDAGHGYGTRPGGSSGFDTGAQPSDDGSGGQAAGGFDGAFPHSIENILWCICPEYD